MKDSKILVTGAKGFVGSEIVKFLEREGWQVFTVENQKNRLNGNLSSSSTRAFAVDITDKNALAQLEKIDAIDAVIHAAGLAHQVGDTKKEVFQKVNVGGTENILELSKVLNVKHFILISSVAVYGHSKHQYKDQFENQFEKVSVNKLQPVKGLGEDAVCAPEDFYAESKLDGENLARKFCEERKIRLTILRLATVVGEGDRGNFLKLIRAIDRRRFVWIGKGENYKSLTHREDVARACLAVLKSVGTGTEVFNVSANFLTMREIVGIVSGKLEKKIPNVFIPAGLVNQFFRLFHIFHIFHNFRVGKIKRLEKTITKWLADDVYSAAKIKRMIGFETQISAEKAVEREVEWYLAKK